MPGPFLNAVERLIARRPELEGKLRVVFLGQKSEVPPLKQVHAFAYPRMLELRDQVTASAAAEMLREASALLLIGGPQVERYRPGKVYEYLASRTPILVFGSGGEVGRLVSDLQAGQVVEEGDVDALEAFIDRLPERRPNPVSNARLDEWLARHTREATSRLFLERIGAIE